MGWNIIVPVRPRARASLAPINRDDEDWNDGGNVWGEMPRGGTRIRIAATAETRCQQEQCSPQACCAFRCVPPDDVVSWSFFFAFFLFPFCASLCMTDGIGAWRVVVVYLYRAVYYAWCRGMMEILSQLLCTWYSIYVL